MKKVAIIIALTLVLGGCSWINNSDSDEVQTDSQTPVIETEVNDTVILEETPEIATEESTTNAINDIIENTDSQGVEITPSNTTETETGPSAEITPPAETSITEELANGTEDEQLLNEVFNEINEVFELVEQNGGQ